MPILGGRFAFHILRAIAPVEPSHMDGSAYSHRSKLETLFGRDLWDQIVGKTVVDFGCGQGTEAIALARKGARKVYGIDISDRWLSLASMEAKRAQCENVIFAKQADELADVILSVDAFEHYADPTNILATMAKLLKANGVVLASFGPTWYHPLGGHLFSIFPWAHLIFSEKELCRWRSRFKTDGAQHFAEVEGGLNQMTIGRFERIVSQSPLRLESLEALPIRRVRLLHNRWTRELFTAVVRCRLVLR